MSAPGGMLRPVVELLMATHVPLGDSVKITLRLRNPGTRTLSLQLPGRPVAFDLIVSRTDGAPVWRRLERGLISSALLLLNLPPGGTKDFVASWGQVDSLGQPMAPGRYRVTGVLPMEGGQLTTATHELLIE